MKQISIFNDVLGPVMRGPSSSHTAGSHNIGRIAVELFGGRPARATICFDPSGSYGRVFREQGVDKAFASALLGWKLTDPRFTRSLDIAHDEGVAIEFEVRRLAKPDHPNTVEIELSGRPSPVAQGFSLASPRTLALTARSIGGGSIEVVALNGREVHLTGETREVVEVDGVARELAPLAFTKCGVALFADAAQILALAEERHLSLGRLALAHEASLLGMPEADAITEMRRRLEVMRASVKEGLERPGTMSLLEPGASLVMNAEAEGRVAVGGLHTRAAARALAAMQTNSSMGVVCAAPTGGSAGVIPAVIETLLEIRSGLISPEGKEQNRPRPDLSDVTPVLALFAAGAIGVVVASRATFAAEVAGCQVEIGAAGAMAAAAVVDAAGGTARQATDAAAIAFQNTMGSVCDLVQGMVEIPCHTRNAVAASSAFVCADLILGGYRNPIPLDETVDAVFAVGKMLPSELRCTARGGLAVTPSALRMSKRRK